MNQSHQHQLQAKHISKMRTRVTQSTPIPTLRNVSKTRQRLRNGPLLGMKNAEMLGMLKQLNIRLSEPISDLHICTKTAH